ncbi:MAG: HlyD family secretion protein [Acidobacteriia bacterium]|jgi:HlyD family secretion protein|nr:HlyD family secretion protein [Terriglobia bacterium]
MSENKGALTPKRNPLKVLIPLLLVGGSGYGVWKYFVNQPQPPSSVVAMTGRIEGDDAVIAPKVPGRILEIRFREGDVVHAGDVIAVLDDLGAKARVDQATAAVNEAEIRRRAAEQQIAIFQEQLQQTELQTDQSRVDAEGRVRQAEADLAGAEAQLVQQEASLRIAAWDRDAYVKLAKAGAVPERQGKLAQATADTQEAVVAAARKRVESARGSLSVAKANLTNPQIRGSQSMGIRKQMLLQQTQIASAAADVVRVRAQLAEVMDSRSNLTITAPFEGTVITRTAEPGEVVQAGTAILTLVDLNRVYLRGFIPQGESGKVRVGQKARVFLDSAATKPLEAELVRIDPQATFTPENTYFRDDRVKQVVGVKLLLKAGGGFAKPGMPADGEVLVEGDTWPPVDYRK